MLKIFLGCLLTFNLLFLLAESERNPFPGTSPCHIFIDDQNIWTLEILENDSRDITPILNIITFSQGQWDFRPPQIHIYNETGQEARVERFSLDTGVAEEPYIMQFMKVRGKSFIGVDLVGNFTNFGNPPRVSIDLGEERFQLQPVECRKFDTIAEQIDKVNVDSPNIWEDFDVLRIQYIGKRELIRE